jgi:hypothetical protein
LIRGRPGEQTGEAAARLVLSFLVARASGGGLRSAKGAARRWGGELWGDDWGAMLGKRVEVPSLDALRALPVGPAFDEALAIGRAHELLIDLARPGAISRRRAAGAHYTPPAVARAVVEASLGPLIARSAAGVPRADRVAALRVADLSMGAGVFLLEAWRYLVDRLAEAGEPRRAAGGLVARRCLAGAEIDPLAAQVARACVALAAGLEAPDLPLLQEGDALLGVTRRAQIERLRLDAGAPVIDASELSIDVQRSLADAITVVGLASALQSPHGAEKAWRALARGARSGALLSPPSRGVFVHWALLSADGQVGLDAVVGNPPFLNAVERRTAWPAARAAFAARYYQPFARGAYDRSLLFVARAAEVLGPAGRYGLILPASLLSSTAPWQQHLHATLRPDEIRLLPADTFGEARIRTTALIGGRGAAEMLSVTDEAGATRRQRWPDRVRCWYEAVAGAPEASDPFTIEAVAGPTIGEVAAIWAGCAVGAAYELAPLVVDDAAAAGPQLVTTGAIDRFRCLWGSEDVRYLGRHLRHPRWPAGDAVPAGVRRARDRQASAPKILVGGLTAVLEAWLDERGQAAGAVSTWVIAPRAGQDEGLAWRLLALLNSAWLSRIYLSRYGAASMNGRQTSIKQEGLRALPIPAALLAPGPRSASIEALARRLSVAHSPALDAALHHLVGALSGQPFERAEADRRWWCARARVDTADMSRADIQSILLCEGLAGRREGG